MTRFCTIVLLAAAAAAATDWSQPVEVRHEDVLCVSYQARLDGPYVVVRATVGPGWHTFAMDNQERAKEKLAGKPALSMDRNTEITGAAIDGPWYQSPPKDFSRPALRWFSWGFDREALFAAKLRAAPAPGTRLRLRGQACTDTICKNIDVELALPDGKGGEPRVNLKELVPVR